MYEIWQPFHVWGEREGDVSRRSRVPESRQLDMMVPLPEVGKTEEGKELWYNEYVFTF